MCIQLKGLITFCITSLLYCLMQDMDSLSIPPPNNDLLDIIGLAEASNELGTAPVPGRALEPTTQGPAETPADQGAMLTPGLETQGPRETSASLRQKINRLFKMYKNQATTATTSSATTATASSATNDHLFGLGDRDDNNVTNVMRQGEAV